MSNVKVLTTGIQMSDFHLGGQGTGHFVLHFLLYYLVLFIHYFY